MIRFVKSFSAMFLLAAFCFGQNNSPITRPNPENSYMYWQDSCTVTGTAAVTLRAAWQDNVGNKAIVIQYVSDDSLYANDSAAVSVTAYQVFPATFGTTDAFIRLNSRANPDSTSKLGSSVFTLFDNLSIATMDTACVYSRNKVLNNQTWGSKGIYPGDSLKTLFTVTPGAFAYTALPFDFSPAIALKLTGLAGNRKGAAQGKWYVRIYGLKGMMTKVGG